MSAKIYLIKNNEGKFLNLEGSEPFFSEHLHLGSYGTNKDKVEEIINKISKYTDLEIHESNEVEFTESVSIATTSLAIKLDSIRVELESLRYNLPTISGLNRNLGNFLKNTSKKIKEINPWFNDFIKTQEDSTFEVSALYEEFINDVSSIEMWECSEISAIIKSYKKDKKSIMGICNKILK